MLTLGVSDSNQVPWEVRAGKHFIKQYQSLSDGSDLKKNADSKIDRICEYPLIGTRKSDELAKLRGHHLDSHVILWKVAPEVTSPNYLDQISRVELSVITHHNDYNGSISRPELVEPTREFIVVFRGEATNDHHLLYDLDGVDVEVQKWVHSNGKNAVVFTGEYEKGCGDTFDERLPDGVGVTTVQRAAEGLDIGVKNKRIVGQNSGEASAFSEVEVVR